MDIKQLRYFTAIVENNFNLSHSANMLYVSQPTLSMMINDFEKSEDVKLFQRERGRIVGLTHLGERYYEDALQVLEDYNTMILNLHKQHNGKEGTVTIGIPPLVLSVVFSTIIPKLILDNPNMTIIIKELGANQLKDELLLGTVDLAVLLAPIGLDNHLIETYPIQESELAAFFSTKNELAQKKQVSWQDFNKKNLVIFDRSFMIHHLLTKTFERENIHPSIIFTSGLWDYMLRAVKSNKEIITILPRPIDSIYKLPGVVCRPIHKPIIWKVSLSRQKKKNYSNAESFIFDAIIKSFNHK